MAEEEFQMDSAISAALKQVIEQLEASEVIQAYQKIERKVDNHPALLALTEEIRQHQQDAVKFAHYGKPVAEQEALRLANQKTQEFDEHPLVIRYRECLTEANDLVQYIVKKVETDVNEGLHSNFEAETRGD